MSSQSILIDRVMDMMSVAVAAGACDGVGWQPVRTKAWMRTSLGPCSVASIGCDRVGVLGLEAVGVGLLLRNDSKIDVTSGDSIHILGKANCRA
jgi:hypothetical protein